MSERDELVAQIRPELALDVTKSTEQERFQNLTLRPILKLQSPLMVEHFKAYLHQCSPRFNAWGQDAQKAHIREVILKDVGLKNDMVTFAVGMLTMDEYRFYHSNRYQLKKRIVQMVISRLQDRLEQLL